jgi:hypothetical protein
MTTPIDWIHRDNVASVAAELASAGCVIEPAQLEWAIATVAKFDAADQARKLRGLERDRQQQALDDVRRRTRERVAFSQR